MRCRHGGTPLLQSPPRLAAGDPGRGPAAGPPVPKWNKPAREFAALVRPSSLSSLSRTAPLMPTRRVRDTQVPLPGVYRETEIGTPRAAQAGTRHRPPEAGRSPSALLLRGQACAAGADQARIGRLEAPESAAVRAHQKDVAVVGSTKSEVGRRQIAVRNRQEN